MKNKLDNVIKVLKENFPTYDWNEEPIFDSYESFDGTSFDILREELEKRTLTVFIDKNINIEQEIVFQTKDENMITSVYTNKDFDICCISDGLDFTSILKSYR